MRRPPALPAIAIVLLAVFTTAGVATASPPPHDVCAGCTASFERAADDAGIDLSVAHSAARVEVHANGTATWRVRNELDSGTAADRFRDEPGLLTNVSRQSLHVRYSGPETDRISNVTAGIEGRTVTITYDVSEFARPATGSLLVVEYFHTAEEHYWHSLSADSVTVVAPNGQTITNSPASGAVSGSTVTWTDHVDDAYVVFGADHSVTTAARTKFALAKSTWPIVRSHIPWLLKAGALVSIPTFALVAFGSRVLSDRNLDGWYPRGLLVAGAAAVGAGVLAFQVGAQEWLTNVILAGGITYTVAGYSARWGSRTRSVRFVVRRSVAAAVPTFAVAGALSSVFSPAAPLTAWSVLGLAFTGGVWAFAFALVFALGHTVGSDSQLAQAIGGLAFVGTYLVAVATVVSITSPPGMFVILKTVLVGLFGASVLALGLPLFSLGMATESGA